MWDKITQDEKAKFLIYLKKTQPENYKSKDRFFYGNFVNYEGKLIDETEYELIKSTQAAIESFRQAKKAGAKSPEETVSGLTKEKFKKEYGISWEDL